jgi:SET domain-containing protein
MHQEKMGYTVRRATAGLGLFATATFKRNDRIIQYVGEVVAFESARASKYLIEIDDDNVIDGACRSNKARYINHSCRPNAVAYIVEREVFIYAKKRIEPGEEITIDYGKDYWDFHIRRNGCRCAPCLKSPNSATKLKSGSAISSPQ